jgi:hypothetical protein
VWTFTSKRLQVASAVAPLLAHADLQEITSASMPPAREPRRRGVRRRLIQRSPGEERRVLGPERALRPVALIDR